MLSESHDNNIIHNYLSEWIRDGAPVPKAVICDQSLALIYAVVKSFTDYTKLKRYSKVCYEIIFDSKSNPINIPYLYFFTYDVM